MDAARKAFRRDKQRYGFEIPDEASTGRPPRKTEPKPAEDTSVIKPDKAFDSDRIAAEAYYGAATTEEKFQALQYLAARNDTRHTDGRNILGPRKSWTNNEETFRDALRHEDPRFRRVALLALDKTLNPKNIAAILDTAANDVSGDIRLAAINIASHILTGFDRNAPDNRVSTSDGLMVFEQSLTNEVWDSLVGAARSSDEKVRAKALEAILDPNIVLMATRQLAGHLASTAQQEIAQSIAEVGGEAWHAQLVALANDRPKGYDNTAADSVAFFRLKYFDDRSDEVVNRLATTFSRYFGGGTAMIDLLEEKGIRTDAYLRNLLDTSWERFTYRGSFYSPMENAGPALEKWEKEVGTEAFNELLMGVLRNNAETPDRWLDRGSVGAIEYLVKNERWPEGLTELLLSSKVFLSHYESVSRDGGKERLTELLTKALSALDDQEKKELLADNKSGIYLDHLVPREPAPKPEPVAPAKRRSFLDVLADIVKR